MSASPPMPARSGLSCSSSSWQSGGAAEPAMLRRHSAGQAAQASPTSQRHAEARTCAEQLLKGAEAATEAALSESPPGELQRRSRVAEVEHALALAREELKAESALAAKARAHGIELRQSHADELLRHARELSAGAEAIAERDAELDFVREEAQQAWEEARRERDAATVAKADSERLAAEARSQAAELEQAVQDLASAVAPDGVPLARISLQDDAEHEEAAQAHAELRELRAVMEAEEECWQGRLREAEAEVGSVREIQEERARLAAALAEGEGRIAALQEDHVAEAKSLGDAHAIILAERDEEIGTFRLEVECMREEVGRQVSQAMEVWKEKLVCSEQQLHTAHEELASVRARAINAQSSSDRAADSSQATLQTYEEELRRRDALHADILSEKDAEMRRVLQKADEEREEGERQRAESDGWRHMLMKMSGDLNASKDEVSQEREKVAKAAMDSGHVRGEMNQAHSEDLARLNRAHEEKVKECEAEIRQAWQEAQATRQEVGRQRADADRIVEEAKRAKGEEISRLEWAHGEALSKKDAEMERVKQELRLTRDEAQFQRAEADEFWQQRCADAEAGLKAAREELTRLRQAQAEDLSNVSSEHMRNIGMRDTEIDRLRKELQHERREAERKRAEADDMWQHRVSEVEGHMKAARVEFQQERDRLLKAQADLERALGELREAHAAELTNALTKQANDLASQDEEVEKLRRELHREREEGERMCSTVDDAWRSRLAENEQDLAELRTELQKAKRDREEGERQRAQAEETAQRRVEHLEGDLKKAREMLSQHQEQAAKARTESKRSLAEIEEAHSEELERRSLEQSKALATMDTDLGAARRMAQAEKEEAEHQGHESQEAWRWLSRVEGDLKTAQKDLKQERESAVKTQFSGEQALTGLRASHAQQLAQASLEHAEVLEQRQSEVGGVRRELQEARTECKKKVAEVKEESRQDWQRKVAEAEEVWQKRHAQIEREFEAAQKSAEMERTATAKSKAGGDRALAELREANVQEVRNLVSRHVEAMEEREDELEDARDELRALREDASQRVAQADVSWHRRIAEAEARGAAGIDLATKAQVDSQRAKSALEALRQDMAEERSLVEELRTRERASAEGLRKACAVAAQAEMFAEVCHTEELRAQALGAASPGGGPRAGGGSQAQRPSPRKSPTGGEDLRSLVLDDYRQVDALAYKTVR